MVSLEISILAERSDENLPDGHGQLGLHSGAGHLARPNGSDFQWWLIFNAFNLCPFDKVKVVIIGQDPYHGPGQAHGLCFSVNDGVRFPPSLINIFKEIKDDIGTDAPTTGNLTRWAEQGVLLLNATLTVRALSVPMPVFCKT